MDPNALPTDAEGRDHKARVQAQFARGAALYVASPTHAEGEDLAQLVAWADGPPDRVALDIATGGGHTALALAPFVQSMVATDLTEPMLQAAAAFARQRGVTNIEFRPADAENLPFAAESFDLASCRIAPHHFGDVARFVREVARVLRPGGTFLLEDSVAPDDPLAARFLNHVETLRDSTHVRTLSRLEWLSVVEDAGLTVERERVIAKAHPFRSWVERASVTDDGKREIEDTFANAPAPIREALRIVVDGSTVQSYSDEKLLVRARKPAGPAQRLSRGNGE